MIDGSKPHYIFVGTLNHLTVSYSIYSEGKPCSFDYQISVYLVRCEGEGPVLVGVTAVAVFQSAHWAWHYNGRAEDTPKR